MRFLANTVLVAVVAMVLGGGLFYLSFDYPHTWMPAGLAFFVIWFFARATWLPTIPFRVAAAIALCMNTTGLFLVSSVQRMNIFQRERPVILDVMLVGGAIATFIALLTIIPIQRGRRKAAVLTFVALLMISAIAYASSSEGGPSPMISFFQHTLGLSAASAETATILVRKTIHFSFYGTLGLLLFLAMRNSKVVQPRAILIALACVLTVACFDEIRQTTADFRSGSPWDVLLDMMGATTFCLTAAATKRVRSL